MIQKSGHREVAAFLIRFPVRLEDTAASHPEVDVVVDPLPELGLGFRFLAGMVVRAPGAHYFVVDRPHANPATWDILLPVHRYRRARIEDSQRRVLREVLETADVDLLVLAQTVILLRR